MPAVSLSRQIDRFRSDMRAGANLVDLGIEVQRPDGSVLYRAGGMWDRRRLKYVSESPAPHVVRLVPSQVEAGEKLAAWFRAYDAGDERRPSLINGADARRGGKSIFITAMVLSFAIRYPWTHNGRTITWAVVPTYGQGREIHDAIAFLVPFRWFREDRIERHRADNYYTLANGAEIWIKSADRPDLLKGGAVMAVGLNEAQQVTGRGLLNVAGANIDAGGLTFLAMNPPDSPKALYLEDLHDAIHAIDDHGKPVLDFAEEVKFPPGRNPTISQAGRARYNKLARVIDKKAAQRDGLGIWVTLRNTAYPLWNRNQHFREEPKGWQDFTAAACALTKYLWPKDKRHWVCGADWQRWPYCCWVEIKVLLAPEGSWLPRGTPLYVVRAEVMNEISRGELWDEDLLCQEVARHLAKVGRKPADYMMVADGTGKNQGASGRQRGKESDPDSWSFAIVERYGWEPHAAIEERRQVVGQQGVGSGWETVPSNPRTAIRLELTNQLLRANRVIVTPDCPETAESFRICELKNKKPFGRGSHLTDAVSYPLFCLERALRAEGVVKVGDQDDAD